MGSIKDSFTFDDVTLIPQYSSVLPSDTITSNKLSNNLAKAFKKIEPLKF